MEASPSESEANISDLSGKYLTFSLAEEHYGIDILSVQEIIGKIEITVVPNCPQHVKGVVNLRGKIIPVVDLRLRLHLNEREYDRRTCFIVVNVELGGKKILIGIVVDTVLEVITLDKSDIQNAPDYGTSIDTSFLLGVCRPNNDVTMLLDIQKILESDSNVLANF